MDEWWYNENSQEIGPRNIDEMKELASSNRIHTDTLIWKKGMDEWLPLHKIKELKELVVNTPPPLPTKDGIAASIYINYPESGAWKRFFARMFDCWWDSLLLQMIAGFILGSLYPDSIDWMSEPGNEYLIAILAIPAALIFDGILQGSTGTSLGKALLGLRVLKKDGLLLNINEQITRNLSLWVSGLALGIPFVNLFTMAHQAGRVGKGEPASYDVESGYAVKAKPLAWYRYVLFAIVFFVLIIIMGIIRQM